MINEIVVIVIWFVIVKRMKYKYDDYFMSEGLLFSTNQIITVNNYFPVDWLWISSATYIQKDIVCLNRRVANSTYWQYIFFLIDARHAYL